MPAGVFDTQSKSSGRNIVPAAGTSQRDDSRTSAAGHQPRTRSHYDERGQPRTTSRGQKGPSSITSDDASQRIPPGISSSDQARKKDLLSTRHLDVMAVNIGKNWRAFGRELRFSDPRLDQLEADYRIHGQREVNYQMLLEWYNKQHEIPGADDIVPILKKHNLMKAVEALNFD